MIDRHPFVCLSFYRVTRLYVYAYTLYPVYLLIWLSLNMEAGHLD
jgi:hypothetical protein